MNLLGYELTIDTGFTGILLLIVIAGAGFFAMYMTLNSQFPKVRIDIRDRGMRRPVDFRLMSTAIFKDDIIGILMGRFEYFGDISKLTYYTLPNGKKIYDAYLRHQYLFAFKDVSVENIKEKPQIDLDWKLGDRIPMKATLDISKGLLCPLELQLVKHTISEVEVQNGKTIGTQYITVMRRARDYIDKQNPVMAVIISSLPMILMAGLFCIMLYVAYLSLGDATIKIVESAEKIYSASRCMA